MGVDAEDVDGDGLPELYVTNFANEYDTLYQNFGKGVFFDNTAFFGLASDTMPFVEAGGRPWSTSTTTAGPTTSSTNGHVDDNRRLLNQPVDYEQIPLLFRNIDGKRFRLSTKDVGPYFEKARRPGRGVRRPRQRRRHRHRRQREGPARRRPPQRHADRRTTGSAWPSRGPGATATRSAPGSRSNVGSRKIYRQRKGGVSLESSQRPAAPDRRRRGVAELTKITIRWPSGVVTTMDKVKVDQTYQIVEPKDSPAASAKPSK